ncbi:hypothetical protein TWF506_009330 [Arthrobotrys conoides]|uniref:Uncharacterized protein n=1 Tax=Arthrobotrys conoides TaxID=74498 RepID=A0AAN8RWZ6_9PEZI
MWSKAINSIVPLLSVLLNLTVATNAKPDTHINNDLTARAVDPNAPPLCRLHAEWVMIGVSGKPLSWPYDQVKMNVWVKDDQKSGWSGWPTDANAVLTNFNVDREKGEWKSLTENLSPDRFSSTCGASEKEQCWTDVQDRPRLRASPQHGRRDSGWDNPGGVKDGNRHTMRDYVQFYWGPMDAVRAAWHTDENGNNEDMYIKDAAKNPFCRLTRDDAAKGVSWQYYIDGSLHVYVDDKTKPSWVVAEGWDIECLFFCPV